MLWCARVFKHSHLVQCLKGRYNNGYSVRVCLLSLKQDTPTEACYLEALKMDYNENSQIKLTIEPCLCCVQVTIYCCGHVFLFIILLQFDRKNETPLLRFLKFPALHWFPTKTH